jgi:hypothetical protein
MIIAIIKNKKYETCYWCIKRRAVLFVEVPTYGIFEEEKMYMCEKCFRIRKGYDPFEVLRYHMVDENEENDNTTNTNKKTK